MLALAGCATPSAEVATAPAPVVVQVQRTSPQCDFRDSVLPHLATKYGERLVAGGISNQGGLVEVLTTADGETWTIIVTRPDGWACLVAAGEGWRTKEPVEPEPEGMAL